MASDDDKKATKQWHEEHGSFSPSPAPAAAQGGGASVTITPGPKASYSGGGTTTSRKAISGASSSGGTAAATPTIDNETLAQQYGFTKSLMDGYPELGRLFNQAVAGGWTPDKFQAELRNTQWFQTQSETARKMVTMKYTDPATYQKMWSQAYDHVQALAGSMGANTSDWQMLDPITSKMFYEGWSDERVRTELGQHITFGTNGLAGGEAGRIQQSIANYSYTMGVKNGDDWMRDRVMKVMSGYMTDQDMKNEVLNQSIAQFPQYEKQLRGGMTMHDLAAPYMQSMSQVLELPPGQVNLFDPTISKAMSYRDPSGNGSAMPLWQFQNDLRQDPRWTKTQNAQDTSMGVAKSILQTFGEVKM